MCLTRQPVLDHRGRVFGYELRFCEDMDRTSKPGSSQSPAAELLSVAILGFNLAELTERRVAFVRFSYDLLLSGVATLVPPAQLAIELSEDLVIDASVIDTCRDLHGRGYALGLDAYAPGAPADVLLPFVSFSKVDTRRVSVPEVAALVTHLRPYGITLIATNVTRADVAVAVARVGCQLVQGYYFCEPTSHARTTTLANQAVQLQLLDALSRDDLPVSALEALVKRDSALCVRVLQAVNAASAGMRREIGSLHEALVLLGRDQIRKWVLLWTLDGMNRSATPATLTMALVRARWCELLGSVMPGEPVTGYFLLGLCSLLDVILDRPMSALVTELPLTRTTTLALLGEPGTAGTVLQSVASYERGDWSGASRRGEAVGLPLEVLAAQYVEAVRWVSAMGPPEPQS